MKKSKNAIYKNKIMEKVFRFNGFQKLLLFCIPLIIVGTAHYLSLRFGNFFPGWVRAGYIAIVLWQMFTCWAWLFISFQIHWEKSTRNLAANISAVVMAILVLLFQFF